MITKPVSIILVALFGLLAIAQPCDAQKPTFVFVTQPFCPPCIKAKLTFESMKRDGSLDGYQVDEWDIRKDRAKIDATGAFVPRTPTFLILDETSQSIREPLNQNDDKLIRDFAKTIPVDCIDPKQVVLPEPVMLFDAPATGPPPVVVTWDLATQYRNGAYNGSFTFNEIENALNGFGLYWNIRYQRVTRGGQFHVVQANYDLGKNVAARTGSTTMLVSPVFRFANAVQCKMVTCHENRHTRIQAHHLQDGGLMGPNGGYLLLQSDMPYFSAMTWKSAKRPWDNPGEFKAYLGGAKMMASGELESFPELHRSQYEGRFK